MPVPRFFRAAAIALFLATVALSGYLACVAMYRSGLETLLTRIGVNATDLLALTDSYVATYSELVELASADGAPVPAAYRAAASLRFNSERSHENQAFAVMVGMPGREISTPPTDANLVGMLETMLDSSVPARMDSLVELGGVPALRTVFPSIASSYSCVDCHNRLQPDLASWAIGDLMGAYVVDTPIGREIGDLQRYAVSAGIFAATVLLLGGLLLRYYRRLVVQKRDLVLLASIDPLTRCLNRRALADAFRDTSEDVSACLLVLDIDHFKKINDVYGHYAGDAVLVQFAERLRCQLRSEDILARVGGEEFVVLGRHTSATATRELAHRLRRTIADEPFKVDDRVLRVTTSLGGLEVPCLARYTLEQLMSRADAYLYQAKHLGRDRVLLPRHVELAR